MYIISSGRLGVYSQLLSARVKVSHSVSPIKFIGTVIRITDRIAVEILD